MFEALLGIFGEEKSRTTLVGAIMASLSGVFLWVNNFADLSPDQLENLTRQVELALGGLLGLGLMFLRKAVHRMNKADDSS